MILFLLFAVARAEVWTMQDIQKMLRESSTSYLSALCEAQLEQRRVPTACYQSADKTLIRFLDDRCAQWIDSEKNIKNLKDWSIHPHLSKRCFQLVHERAAELEYILEEKAPLEYFRSQLAQNLKSKSSWNTVRNRKPSAINSLNASAKD